MNKGFYLTLMMGSFNASPVPLAVIEALTDVQVTSSMGGQGGFQLKFTLGKNSPLAQLHEARFFDPRKRVIIAVTVNGATEVLMDGIITKQDLTPSGMAGKATLSITGLDLTEVMNFIDFTGIPYPALPEFLIVQAILAKYAVLGIIPVAVPASIPNIQNPLENWSAQQGTDYSFVSGLASGVGAVFYLDPGPTPGRSMAYWGPDLTRLFGGTQPALSINFDASSNLDSLSFSFDGTLATQYIAVIIEKNSKAPIPVPVPNLDILRPSLGANLPAPLRFTQLRGLAYKTLPEAANTALGYLFKDRDVITASGSMDVLRYGHIFKARQLAAVRGAGSFYDGKYYVKSVTHSIKRGEYKQNFTLSRGGIGSSVSTVTV